MDQLYEKVWGENRDEAALMKRLHILARDFLQGFTLYIADKPHRLIEIEFYYYSENFQDLFSHRHALSRRFGKWYFHAVNPLSEHPNYRGGSYKGLDLTLGALNSIDVEVLSKESQPKGLSMLIRCIQAIQPISSSSYVYGPSKIVDYILVQNDVASIHELVDTKLHEFNAFKENSGLHFTYEPNTYSISSILKSSRVGLNPKRHTLFCVPYLLAPLRFLAELHPGMKDWERVALETLCNKDPFLWNAFIEKLPQSRRQKAYSLQEIYVECLAYSEKQGYQIILSMYPRLQNKHNMDDLARILALFRKFPHYFLAEKQLENKTLCDILTLLYSDQTTSILILQ